MDMYSTLFVWTGAGTGAGSGLEQELVQALELEQELELEKELEQVLVLELGWELVPGQEQEQFWGRNRELVQELE
jgi:hypothetical protein